MTSRLAAKSVPDTDTVRSRRDRDWRNGTLLIAAITALPIVVVALLRLFLG